MGEDEGEDQHEAQDGDQDDDQNADQHGCLEYHPFDESIVAHFRFFQICPHLIEPVVDHFIGVHGLHNPDAKLRSRCSYLFSRFTKDLK